MFLTELNKDEAKVFINLVEELANVDGNFATEEKELVSDYLEELGLKQEEVAKLDHAQCVSELGKSSDRIRNIIFFEIVGLAVVDGEFEDSEVEFLNKLAEELKVTKVKKAEYINYFENFIEIYKFSTVEADNKIKLLKEEAEEILNQ